MMKKILLILIILSISLSSMSNAKEFKENTLPDSFSWNDVNGVDYTTAVKNQAPAPTCEAYALCACLETIMQYQLKEIYQPDLSETHLYFYANGTYERGYVNIVDAATYLQTIGVPDEGCYPDPHRPFDYPFESLPDWHNRTVKISDWGWVEKSPDSIKNAIIEYGPLAACFYLYKDFIYYTGGIYHHKWGEINNGHVMAIVGYNDVDQYWIIKNSAGSDWGEHGYCRMAYDSTYFAEWYGEGTGVMYITGPYGNLKPDVPKVYITSPEIFTTYVYGNSFHSVFNNIFLQKASPRIFGPLTVNTNAEDTDYVEFYLDGELKYVDEQYPFSWNLEGAKGYHTLQIKGFNEKDISMDIIDIYIF
jgi:hypothetical protein